MYFLNLKWWQKRFLRLLLKVIIRIRLVYYVWNSFVQNLALCQREKCIYVALSGLILAKNFATRQNNYNLTLTHQSGPFPCCYTLVVRVYTIYIFLFLGMLNMTIQTYAKSHMSDGVATKDTRVYKSLTRAYNQIEFRGFFEIQKAWKYHFQA